MINLYISIYRQVSYGQMVACENPDCETEWFHFACVGLTSEVLLICFINCCVANSIFGSLKIFGTVLRVAVIMPRPLNSPLPPMLLRKPMMIATMLTKISNYTS